MVPPHRAVGGLELGGPWSLLEGPQSQLGGLWSQLGGPWSWLEGSLSNLGASWEGPGACQEGLRASWEGPGASWEGPGASWEAWSQLGGPAERPGGDGDRKRERKNRALPVCGGTIGHRPLRGRCPKVVEKNEKRKSH